MGAAAGAMTLQTRARCLCACPAAAHFLKEARMSVTATHAGSRHTEGFDLGGYLEARTAAVNEALEDFLPKETAKPATIHKAMRYSLFAGGKRMRPALCLAAAEACGGTQKE